MTRNSFAPGLFEGRAVLITGATSGIGAACAVTLDALGAKIVASGRDSEKLHRLCKQLRNAIAFPAALDAPGAADRLAAQALESGPIDGLVNSAGFGLVKRSSRLSEDEIDRHFAVNVRASMLLGIRLGEAMKESKAGAIVNLSSIQGTLGTPHQIAYAATKGAVDAMTRALARELGPHGIRVNAVAPGLVATEMWGSAVQDETFMTGAAANSALRKWATPEMIADVVAFLLSDASSYITGEVLTVDGGLTRTGNLVPESAFGKK